MSAVLALEPRPITEKTFLASNVFCVRSPKLHGRGLKLLGPSLFDTWLLLEFDANVTAFCERPRFDVAIAGSKRPRGLDFWTARRDGVQQGVIVYGASAQDKRVSLEILRSSLHASKLNCLIWPESDLLLRRTLLRNLKEILPYINQEGAVDGSLSKAIDEEVRSKAGDGISLRELLAIFRARHPTQVAASLFDLFHRGRVAQAALETCPLSTDARWTHV